MMAMTKQNEAHLSPPVMGRLRTDSPSDVSDHSANSSDWGYASSRGSSLGGGGGGGPRGARKRASKPKVRTGCISCKRRHVKCDEEKPSCAECDRIGIMCEGYAPPKILKRGAARPERLLLPKLASSSSTTLSPSLAAATSRQPGTRTSTPSLCCSTPRPRPPPAYSPAMLDLGEQDGWYFVLFRDRVAHELSPCRQSANFWSRIALRDSTASRCIRHSLLSIGASALALMEARRERGGPGGGGYDAARSSSSGGSGSGSGSGSNDRAWWPPTVLNRHHQAALMHHDRALSHLQSDIRSGEIDGRMAMAATLLFIVFENMQGNYHSSGDLIRSGIKMLTSVRGAGRGLGSALRHQRHRYATTPPDEVDEMADMFARHSITNAYMPLAHGKMAYHLVLSDDEDTGAPPAPPAPAPAPAPAPFDDPHHVDHHDHHYEYDHHYDHQHHDHQHYHDDNAAAAADATSWADLEPEDDPYWQATPCTLAQARRKWDYLLPQLADFHTAAAWRNLHPGFPYDDGAARREQAALLRQLAMFRDALDALHPHAVPLHHPQAQAMGFPTTTGIIPPHPPPPPPPTLSLRDAAAADLLRVEHEMAVMATACCLDPTEAAYDGFAPRFRAAVRQTRALVAALEEAAADTAGTTTVTTGSGSGVGGGGGYSATTTTTTTTTAKVAKAKAAADSGFVNEAGPLPVLGFMAAKCRDARVRRAALRLVRRHRWREGTWDADSLAGIIEGLMRLEGQVVPPPGEDEDEDEQEEAGEGEEGEEDMPPPEARFTCTNMFWDVKNRSLRLEYHKILPDEWGVFERAENVVPAGGAVGMVKG
ncbi:hypothetical protein GGR56DRAFT_682753 [Xylariaceae sp. FL0804]|nr:hypothetical protein GGR56DRAFT_682753 [Xylariaceae sp. FL0804]